jgi:hypothetical protein
MWKLLIDTDASDPVNSHASRFLNCNGSVWNASSRGRFSFPILGSLLLHQDAAVFISVILIMKTNPRGISLGKQNHPSIPNYNMFRAAGILTWTETS